MKRLTCTAIIMIIQYLTFSIQHSFGQILNDNIGSGNCLDFDGTNDFIDCGDINAATFDGVNDQLTLEVWIMPDASVVGPINIVNKYNSNISQMTFSMAVGGPGNLEVGIFNNFTGKVVGSTAAGTVQYDEWNHLAFTANLATQTYVFYINGEIYPVTPTSTGTAPTVFNNTNTSFEIGSITNTGGSRQFANAQIDEVRLWNVIRTQNELQDNMCTTLQGNETGLVGYWNMNEGTGGTVTDLTVNGNNGALQ